jgi:hypothetical protein
MQISKRHKSKKRGKTKRRNHQVNTKIFAKENLVTQDNDEISQEFRTKLLN